MTIKDYIIKYQKTNNKQQLINDLVSYVTVIEINNDGGKDQIKQLKFNDKLMNGWLFELKQKYHNVPRQDIEDAVLAFINESNVFDNTDVTRSANEIARYVRKSFFGFVGDWFAKNLHFNKNVITEQIIIDDDDDDEQELSLYGVKAYQDWLTTQYEQSYGDYLDVIGGLDKVLTKRQLDVLTMSTIMPQTEVAKRLGVTEASISKTLSEADKRLKKNYTNWKITKIMSDTSETKIFDKIKKFLEQLEAIEAVDIDGNFNYFDYTINWLKQNSTDKDFTVDFEQLHSNKIDLTLSVVDVIFDNIHKSQFQLISNVLEHRVNSFNEDVTFTKRQQERFVKAVLQAFYKYIDEVENSVKEFIETAIDNLSVRNDEKRDRNKHDDYDELIKVMFKKW